MTAKAKRLDLRKPFVTLISSSIVLLLSLALFILSPKAQSPKPNIIYIMLDDADICDFGAFCPDADDTDTPNIDALAAGGLVFSQFYSAAPVCSPARISMLSGMYPVTTGYETAITGTGIDDFSSGPDTSEIRFDKRGMASGIETLPELLKQAGYTTAHFGKWHIGQFRNHFRPAGVGFDQWVVAGSGWHSYTDFELNVNGQIEDYHDGNSYQPVILTDKIISFTTTISEPFFINAWYVLPHYPVHIPPGYTNPHGYDLATNRGQIQAMMDVADQQIGRIVGALDAAGKLDNTLIIITSDNGGWLEGTQRPERKIRGYKEWLTEGGIRAPLILHWPAGLLPGIDDRIGHFIDLLPTLANIAGVDPGETVGYDLLGPEPPERALIWEFQGSFFETGDPLHWAIRKGDWKYINSDKAAGLTGLYNLVDDPNETAPVTDRPDLEAELRTEYYRLRRQHSQIPTPVISGTVPFDDRLNFHVGNQTVILDAIIREGITSTLAERGNIWRLGIDATGILSLTVRGEMPGAADKTVTLMADKGLTPELHRLGFTAIGYKRDQVSLRLVADGKTLAYLSEPDSIQAAASDISSGIVLSPDVVSIEAYAVGLGPVAFGEISVYLPIVAKK